MLTLALMFTQITCFWPSNAIWIIDTKAPTAIGSHETLCPVPKTPCMFQFKAMDDGLYHSVYRPLCLIEDKEWPTK